MLIDVIRDEVYCQGLYHRKYEILHHDGNAGGTSAKKLWADSRMLKGYVTHSSGEKVNVMCKCCTTYIEWKKKHQDASRVLQHIADMPCHYRLCNETVTVGTTTYETTIRAMYLAPLGACKGVALKSGPHPYICDACEALQHGKSSQLLHKFGRASKLKHPRTVQNRATQCGVNHRYCSKEHLEIALQSRALQNKTHNKKITQLKIENEKLLLDSWKHTTARPFVEQLLKLFDENKLSDFDLNFLDNWLAKKVNGRFFHAGEQARNLAILLSNRLGEKMYSTVAPMMGLPLVRQTQRLRAKECSSFTYMPGINDWPFKLASEKFKPFHNSMDGTRVIRTIELYENEYLVGESFPTDVRSFPEPHNLPKLVSREQVQEYVLSVRAKGKYAAEAYSLDLVDTTGKLSDILLGSFPEAASGVTASHLYALMLEIERKAAVHNVSLIGHCTDSASNSLKALIKLATPSGYLVEHKISFLGLKLNGFNLYAPFFRSNFPSIAYACWDHSGRTVLRNLMNKNRIIIAQIQESSGSIAIEYKSIATVQDLHQLKRVFPASIIKHGDISTRMHQNCDATTRVLTKTVITELQEHVPASNATQLYIQAAVWTHCPYRNEKYGSPPSIARSLWAGLMTWRRWRQYINISPRLSLEINFISRQHYLTEELLVHAGINHLLCLYLCFPDINLSDYNLRHTGNRGIEAIHGMFRGGTCSLPITSPNLSFREFLSKMNKAQQLQRAEHLLRGITGNSIVASKKKRKTCAAASNEPSSSDHSAQEYHLPPAYEEFLQELKEACQKGNEDSKKMIESLAPQMATTLKEGKQWEEPDVPLEDIPDNMHIVSSISDANVATADFISDLITRELGVSSSETELSNPSNSIPDDSNQALANYLVDIMPLTIDKDQSLSYKGKVFDSQGEQIRATTLLKGLQPHREAPNKNRGKRFAAGEISSDRPLHMPGNSIEELQFWSVYPTSQALRKARVFLLGRITLILNEGNPCASAEKNPSVEVVLTIYEYDKAKDIYYPKGKSALLNVMKFLQTDVSKYIEYGTGSDVKLLIDNIEELHEYVPFTPDINIESRVDADIEKNDEDNMEAAETEEEEPFNVDNIVKKQFNSKLGQYEFLVKWKGYSTKHNTWELINNIPDSIVTKFELDSTKKATEPPKRPGLRDRSSIKAKSLPEYLSND